MCCIYRYTQFFNCDISRCTFIGCNLSDTEFVYCRFQGEECNFYRAETLNERCPVVFAGCGVESMVRYFVSKNNAPCGMKLTFSQVRWNDIAAKNQEEVSKRLTTERHLSCVAKVLCEPFDVITFMNRLAMLKQSRCQVATPSKRQS